MYGAARSVEPTKKSLEIMRNLKTGSNWFNSVRIATGGKNNLVHRRQKKVRIYLFIQPARKAREPEGRAR